MARMTSRFASLAAIAAAFSLAAATPAEARGYYGHRHHDGIDGGDILAGILIIGGIAAIASAASNSSKHKQEQVRDDYRYPQPYQQQRYDYQAPPPPAPASSNYQSGGINNAVNMCVDQVERGDTRVAAVDNASRTADGWHVSGQLSRGGGFSCSIDNEGRIRQLDVGDRYSAYNDAPQGSQWSDQDYARARAQANASADDGQIDGDLAYAGN